MCTVQVVPQLGVQVETAAVGGRSSAAPPLSAVALVGGVAELTALAAALSILGPGQAATRAATRRHCRAHGPRSRLTGWLAGGRCGSAMGLWRPR